METVLSAKELAHTFDYDLFSNVSLTLHNKETIAIVGESGSGKSTLLHILSSLLSPTEGTVELFGQDIYKLNTKQRSKLKREKIGLVFQSHYLFKGLSGYENLEVAQILSNQPIEQELLEKLGIDHCISQKVTELSGGQQQRVSIARVLTKKPKIIFADEPTGNLDEDTASEVMALFFEYCEQNNASMILVTHDNNLAMKCDKVFKLQNQELVEVK